MSVEETLRQEMEKRFFGMVSFFETTGPIPLGVEGFERLREEFREMLGELVELRLDGLTRILGPVQWFRSFSGQVRNACAFLRDPEEGKEITMAAVVGAEHVDEVSVAVGYVGGLHFANSRCSFADGDALLREVCGVLGRRSETSSGNVMWGRLDGNRVAASFVGASEDFARLLRDVRRETESSNVDCLAETHLRPWIDFGVATLSEGWAAVRGAVLDAGFISEPLRAKTLVQTVVSQADRRAKLERIHSHLLRLVFLKERYPQAYSRAAPSLKCELGYPGDAAIDALIELRKLLKGELAKSAPSMSFLRPAGESDRLAEEVLRVVLTEDMPEG
jgi:hypothetical protein